MLILAKVQTADALYTNESIHFNNRSPIWHRGPSSTLHPGRGSHSCFQTAVHYEPPGPRINCSDLIWPCDKEKTFMLKIFFPEGLSLDCLRSWVLWAGDRLRSPEICAWTILAVKGGENICHHRLSLKQKCAWILYWCDLWNTTGKFVQCSKLCESSVVLVALWRSAAPCGGPSVVCQSALAFSTSYSSLNFFLLKSAL